MEAPSTPPGQLRSYLAKFLFTGEDIFKPVGILSGGEQSRLALAKLIYSRANVLVMDEPTNHLDIPSREALEAALAEYAGTVIMVSHDRYFLDKLATEILHFENGRATYHAGSYSDFFALRQREKMHGLQQQTRRRQASTKSSNSTGAKLPKRPRRSAEEIEAQIHATESELASLVETLASPPPDWRHEQYVEINERQQLLSAQLHELYAAWEEATEAGLS